MNAARAPVIRDLGRTDYAATWEAMRAFTAGRTPDTGDELWITSHAPVYTVGVAGRARHLPRVDNGIPVVQSDRGGQITYHGPGQVLVYVLLDLRRHGLTVRPLVRLLEAAITDSLDARGIAANGDAAAPGVYVDGAKIAALGLRIRSGCSYHGLAFNVDPDLSAFQAIDPCGYPGLAVTSAARLGLDTDTDRWAAALTDGIARRLGALATMATTG